MAKCAINTSAPSKPVMYVAILAQYVCKFAQFLEIRTKKNIFLFIQPFLCQKLMDLAGYHDFYTNL